MNKIVSDSKYYDYPNCRPINIESDGCDLAEWDRLYGDCSFAWHPKGFKIFLPPDRLLACDEYSEGDPYTVNMHSEFHTRRIDLTVELVRTAVSSIQGTPEILDLGCGRGYITEKIRQSIRCARISGLDHSVSAIEYAHTHFPLIDFVVGDAYDPPYSPGFFDVVVCNNLWEHVPDPLFVLSRIRRITKPGGYLVLSTPNRHRLSNLLRVLRGKPVTFMSQHHVTDAAASPGRERPR